VKRNAHFLRPLISAWLVVAGAAGIVAAQSEPPARDHSTLTLDELLGLEEQGLARDRQKDVAELIAKLAGQEIGGGGAGGADVAELFMEAVAHMRESSLLLNDLGQAGLPTQRQQEEALRKLDLLIAQASKQSQSQQQSQAQQKPGQDPGSQQNGQQGQNNNAGMEESRGGDNRPPLRETQLNDGTFDESGSEWGGLPPRVRELLRQGRIDASARLYRRLTEAYYRRLAEENEP
jgi:hypothetical protein